MLPLGLLSCGESAEVVEVRQRSVPLHEKTCCGCDGRMEEMGLRAGKVVEMLNNEGKGAIVVKVDQTRIALGRGMAMKVMVRRNDR